MSKFTNSTAGNTPFKKTVNKAGGSAFEFTKTKEKLVTQVLTSFFKEPKYYGDNSNDLVLTARQVIKEDPKFVANLAMYAREVLHMRSTPQVLVAELARATKGESFVKDAISRVSERVDDTYEILGYYMQTYGKPVPNSIKKGVATALQKFDAYQLAKYNRTGKKPSLKDVICLCHPKARPEYKQVIEGTITPPITWEVVMSTTPKANHKSAWESLVAENRLGYMASLRNLRNMMTNNINNYDKVLSYLTNDKAVAGSKQLPFRFFSAYREMEQVANSGQAVGPTLKALETAITKAVVNMPKFAGTTAFISDNSGSMGSPLSSKSTVSYIDVGSLFSALGNQFCDKAITIAFGQEAAFVPLSGMSVFEDMRKVKAANVGHATNLNKAFELLLKNRTKVDRIVVFSDMQAYGTSSYYGGADANKMLELYKKEINPDVILHSVDLAGYGSQQFVGKNVNLIAGWSDKVWDFMRLAELGSGGLIKEIQNYK